MALKPFYTPVVLFIVSMFCRCFPFNSSRPVQPPTHSPAPIAHRIDVVRAQQNTFASSSKQSWESRMSNSNLQIVKLWRKKLQTHEEKLLLTKSTLEAYRNEYSDEEAKHLAQEASLKKMKKDGKGRWDSKEQSERGKKGGGKGGSANTQHQFEARQAVGKKYGQKTGLGNQSPSLKDVIQRRLGWKHENFPDKTFFTNPSTSAKEIINQLECFVPGQIRQESAFYKVLHNERQKMYGWEVVDKGIRSEAEGGKGPSERSETST